MTRHAFDGTPRGAVAVWGACLAASAGFLACSGVTDAGADPDADPDSSATEASYTLVRLPTEGGFGIARAIDEAGIIVGWTHDENEIPHAVVWRDGEVERLPGLGDGSSGAEDINAAGWIVGHAQNADGQPRAVLWLDGEPHDLGTLGGAFSYANGVNDRGQIVGSSETASGAVHAFLWDDGAMRDLGVLDRAEDSSAEAINDRGQVVGSSIGGELVQRATLWDAEGIVDLGTLGNESGAVAIDASGRIAGASIPHHQTSALAVLWAEGTLRELGTLGGEFSNASGMDDRGRVVGSSQSAECFQCPFLWEDGTMRNLGPVGEVPGGAVDLGGEEVTVVGFADGPALWTTEDSVARAWTEAAPTAARVGPSWAALPPRAGPDAEAPGPRPRWAEAVCRVRGPLGGGPGRSAIEVAAGC